MSSSLILEERLTILFLARALTIGGAERQLVTLASGLQKRGHDVHVALFYSDSGYTDELHRAGVSIHPLLKSGVGDLIGFTSRLNSVVKRVNPDIIHSYLAGPNVFAAALRSFWPASKLVWGIRGSETQPSRYSWSLRAGLQLERLLAKRADLIISNSLAGKRDSISRGFPQERITVIPNGIDTERYKYECALRASFRHELGIEPDDLLVGSIARLDPMKDHETFLRAAARLNARRNDLKFICIGDGNSSYRSFLETLTDELGIRGALTWLGSRKDTPAIFNGLDVAVSSSAYGEGFPNVLGEAMACGVPCVATDVGDSRQIVGEFGFVVPARDPQAIADAIEKALAVDREAFGRASRARVEELYSIECLLTRTETALLQLAHG